MLLDLKFFYNGSLHNLLQDHWHHYSIACGFFRARPTISQFAGILSFPFAFYKRQGLEPAPTIHIMPENVQEFSVGADSKSAPSLSNICERGTAFFGMAIYPGFRK